MSVVGGLLGLLEGVTGSFPQNSVRKSDRELSGKQIESSTSLPEALPEKLETADKLVSATPLITAWILR